MGSDEDPRDFDCARKIFWIGIGGLQVFGILAIILMSAYLNLATPENKSTFTWNESSNLHIILMLVFFVILQGYVILVFRILNQKRRFMVKLLHFALHFCVTIGALLGLLSMISYKNVTVWGTMKDKSAPLHVLSLHSWLGVGALVLYFGQFLAGFAIFLLPFAPTRIRALALPVHKGLGTVIFIITGLAAMTGCMHKTAWKDEPLGTKHFLVQFAGVFLALFIITVIYLVMDYRFRRRPRPEGDILLEDASRDEE